jgi:hypothetical protein
MADGLDNHASAAIVDPVDNPVVSSTGAVKSLELKAKRVADPLGHLGQGSVDELDGCDRYLLR